MLSNALAFLTFLNYKIFSGLLNRK